MICDSCYEDVCNDQNEDFEDELDFEYEDDNCCNRCGGEIE